MALTRLGLAAERATRCFWPVWSVLFLGLAPLMMGWHETLPVEAVWFWGVAIVAGLGVTLVRGALRFRWPTEAEAVARVDAALPGRPISAIADRQAVGAADPASVAVWQAHLRRMAERTRAARAVEPDLRVSSRDPFGLRYIALLFFVTALLFGSLLRVGTVADVATPGGREIATGPVWEGWIEPPAYTGKPSLYLADIPQGLLQVPAGSRITLRLYGEPGALTVDETVSGRTGTEETGELSAASAPTQSFEATRDGRLAIEGPGGAEWDVRLMADAAPEVELAGPPEVEALGEMAQPFAASDDYGVVSGQAVIRLDLDALDRRFGLAAEPDAREPLVVDLPMPFTGDRTEFTERLVGDFSQHPWANLPVTLSLEVTDAAGQAGYSVPEPMTLPGRRFFQPIARAVIEQRRDLLWARENGPRVARMLRAVSWQPDGFFPNETTYLRMRFAIRQLEAMLASDGGLTAEGQDEIAQALWDLAIQLEEGTLADARERLQRAQDRLAEAMRNGASQEEIAELMNELREAMDEYMRMLAQNAQPGEDQTDQPQSAQNESMEITRDELQALMDRIQELMEQLNQMMQNMQVTQGEGGQGQQSMEDLGQTLRDQQELSDEAFRDLQEQFNGRQPGEQGQQGQQGQGQQFGQNSQPGQQGQGQPGQQPGQAPGAQGEGQGGESPEGSLADRQQALRDELNRQRGNLPALDGEAAEEAGRALDRAEGAMDRAEEALREGDLAEAIDRQSEALDALREGMRNLGEALAENSQQQPGQGTERGEATGRVEPSRRDPLGRELGNSGQFGTEENMLDGEALAKRADELLQELRRRSSEQERPEAELDYLKRLLERF